MIEVDKVWKVYDDVVAIRDVSLSIPAGQTLGLIGPNGSGKTTLLRMMATLAKPDHGSIGIAGNDTVGNPRAIRRQLAFMPAEFGVPGDMNVREYLEYFAALGGATRGERKVMVDDVLALTDLADRQEIIVRGMSTGNKQRLLLAKTLLGDPQLLLLDEPASGLDPRARSDVRAILKELAKMGKTIIVSSHILADLQDICSHVCILEEGVCRAYGAVDDLRDACRGVDRVLAVRVPADAMDAAAELLAALPDVLRCQQEDGHLQVASAETNTNFILRALLDADIQVLELQEERPDLEAVFIRTTTGKVS